MSSPSPIFELEDPAVESALGSWLCSSTPPPGTYWTDLKQVLQDQFVLRRHFALESPKLLAVQQLLKGRTLKVASERKPGAVYHFRNCMGIAAVEGEPLILGPGPRSMETMCLYTVEDASSGDSWRMRADDTNINLSSPIVDVKTLVGGPVGPPIQTPMIFVRSKQEVCIATVTMQNVADASGEEQQTPIFEVLEHKNLLGARDIAVNTYHPGDFLSVHDDTLHLHQLEGTVPSPENSGLPLAWTEVFAFQPQTEFKLPGSRCAAWWRHPDQVIIGGNDLHMLDLRSKASMLYSNKTAFGGIPMARHYEALLPSQKSSWELLASAAAPEQLMLFDLRFLDRPVMRWPLPPVHTKSSWIPEVGARCLSYAVGGPSVHPEAQREEWLVAGMTGGNRFAVYHTAITESSDCSVEEAMQPFDLTVHPGRVIGLPEESWSLLGNVAVHATKPSSREQEGDSTSAGSCDDVLTDGIAVFSYVLKAGLICHWIQPDIANKPSRPKRSGNVGGGAADMGHALGGQLAPLTEHEEDWHANQAAKPNIGHGGDAKSWLSGDGDEVMAVLRQLNLVRMQQEPLDQLDMQHFLAASAERKKAFWKETLSVSEEAIGAAEQGQNERSKQGKSESIVGGLWKDVVPHLSFSSNSVPAMAAALNLPHLPVLAGSVSDVPPLQGPYPSSGSQLVAVPATQGAGDSAGFPGLDAQPMVALDGMDDLFEPVLDPFEVAMSQLGLDSDEPLPPPANSAEASERLHLLLRGLSVRIPPSCQLGPGRHSKDLDLCIEELCKVAFRASQDVVPGPSAPDICRDILTPKRVAGVLALARSLRRAALIACSAPPKVDAAELTADFRSQLQHERYRAYPSESRTPVPVPSERLPVEEALVTNVTMTDEIKESLLKIWRNREGPVLDMDGLKRAWEEERGRRDSNIGGGTASVLTGVPSTARQPASTQGNCSVTSADRLTVGSSMPGSRYGHAPPPSSRGLSAVSTPFAANPATATPGAFRHAQPSSVGGAAPSSGTPVQMGPTRGTPGFTSRARGMAQPASRDSAAGAATGTPLHFGPAASTPGARQQTGPRQPGSRGSVFGARNPTHRSVASAAVPGSVRGSENPQLPSQASASTAGPSTPLNVAPLGSRPGVSSVPQPSLGRATGSHQASGARTPNLFASSSGSRTPRVFAPPAPGSRPDKRKRQE